MNNYYFTFGSYERFPFQNAYVIIIAEDKKQAIEIFRTKYPDIHKGIINCSDIYTEEVWNSFVKRYYQNPAEIIDSSILTQEYELI